MNRVILIYDMHPEETFFYNLELNDDDFEKIKSCHGHFINSCNVSDNPYVYNCLNWLYSFIEDKKLLIYSEGTPFIFKDNETLTIVHSGFYI